MAKQQAKQLRISRIPTHSKVKRDQRFTIRASEQTRKQFIALAAEHGMKLSTLFERLVLKELKG
jgi:hypothetical protein